MKASRLKTYFIYAFSLLILSFSISAQIIGVQRGGKENNPENLSDQDKHISENYNHSGYLDRQKEEACANDKEACGGLDQGNQNFKMVAKAFGMIVGMLPSDGAFKQNVTKGGETQTNADGTKKEEKKQDYCRYIAVGTEMVAQFQQQATQTEMSSIPVKKETAQKESLDRAARSHEARAENAKYQVAGWGTTTVCYGYMAATASSVGGMGWFKLAMAGVMTGFYYTEMDKHKKAAAKVRGIAKKLGGLGDCNPVTEKNCYCSQPESMNDVAVCMPQIKKRQVAANSVQVACLDSKLKADPQCHCATTDTCYDKQFMHNIDGLDFGTGFNQGVTGPLRKLARGELTGGNAVGSANRQAALAKQAMRKIKGKGPAFTGSLNKSQKSEALALSKMGVPANIAAGIASRKVSASSVRGARNRFGGNVKYAAYRGRKGKSRSKILSF
ncbi:MAG: hypothetical protein KC493_09130, partial [Bacteriovoracaceae bacterium]|nr:hypothetical protein [Bacteriovoracaceae bacterium]